jgi:esterase/lipase superfamily enzyme
MGNRFFEGTLRKTPQQPGEDTLFNTLILFSPDLDVTVTDPDFLRLCQSAKEVAVFIHRRDRLLMLSEWALGRERLGRSGPKGDITTFTALTHLSVIDMTDYVGGFQNHTHLDKGWVQERLREVLEN